MSVILTLGVACADDDSAGVEPPAGLVDELRLALFSAPQTLDPQLAELTDDWSILKQLYRGLFWYDEDLNLVPMVAEELPTVKNGGISSDGLVYRVTLRNDVTWSDGQPLTAFDFEYSIKRALEPSLQSPSSASFFDLRGAEAYNNCVACGEVELQGLRDDVGVKAEDPRTIVFTLRSPRATFPYLLTTVAASPVREDLINQYGEEWLAPENLVTSGPFIVEAWAPDTQVILAPNPNWWGNDTNLRRITITTQMTPEDAFSAYLAGNVDAVLVSGELQATVDADPILSKENVQLNALASIAYFVDHSEPPFDNPQVRQAISMAIDRDAFVSHSPGPFRAGLTWIPPGVDGHDEDLGEDLQFDAEDAREVLQEAGHADGTGLVPITYAYINENPVAFSAAQFFHDQLAEYLGIEVELQPLSREEWLDLYFGGQLQVFFTGEASEFPDAEGFLAEYWTCQRYEGDKCVAFAGGNYSHYANPEFDRIMQQAVKETETKRRVNLYKDAEAILVGDAAAVFLGYENRSVLVKPYVKGGHHTPLDWLPFEYFLDEVSIGD
jgi:oligopeptide transport system substrate-binding protein